MRPSSLLYGVVAAALLAPGAPARPQATTPTPRAAPRAEPRVRAYTLASEDDDDRPMIGISTSTGGKRDTLGLLISGITEGGPADKAGLEEGNRIASVNGVSLKLSRDDAGEDDMDGVMTRRLVRELRKVKAGDDVTLVVWAGGQTKTVKVTTVASDELMSRRTRVSRDEMRDRAVLGIELGQRTSRRDTLGVLVTDVEPNGPADKAGIEEGNRIASINGADLRASEDMASDEDRWFGNYLSSRLTRQMRKVKAGDVVELRVYANGQYRTVKVTAGKASEVYKDRRFGFSGEFGDFLPFITTPKIDMQPAMEGLRQSLRGLEKMRIEAPRIRMNNEAEGPIAPRVWMNSDDNEPVTLLRTGRGFGRGFAMGSGNFLGLSGLSMTEVNADLAEYFGAGSEKGALVLQAEKRWPGIKAGDVVLSINGKAVRDEDGLNIRIDDGEDNAFELIRKGKKMTVTVKGDR
jgi:serine protease Do